MRVYLFKNILNELTMKKPFSPSLTGLLKRRVLSSALKEKKGEPR
jgi:hypothetical protein